MAALKSEDARRVEQVWKKYVENTTRTYSHQVSMFQIINAAKEQAPLWCSVKHGMQLSMWRMEKIPTTMTLTPSSSRILEGFRRRAQSIPNRVYHPKWLGGVENRSVAQKDPKNYRPICLFSHIYRLFTTAITNRLTGFSMNSNRESKLDFAEITALRIMFSLWIGCCSVQECTNYPNASLLSLFYEKAFN